MKGHGQKLSRKQETTIAALLMQRTLSDAAKAAGVGETTLWRWLQQPEFQSAYRTARAEAVSQAIARLQRIAGAAVTTLGQVMIDKDMPPAVRVAAARTVLEMALRGTEVENYVARVAELERALHEGEPAVHGGHAGNGNSEAAP